MPFLNKLSSLHLMLTPQEVDVASLVRQGKSSQEIADVFGLSVNTISFHRKICAESWVWMNDRGICELTFFP
jgi:DNA-binding NarL/FixJ family response regulator